MAKALRQIGIPFSFPTKDEKNKIKRLIYI
jgi:hypothetical protein